jgi:hypothetical protein
VKFGYARPKAIRFSRSEFHRSDALTHPQYATKRPLSGAVVGKTFAILKYRKGGHQGRPTVANRTSGSPSLRIGVRIARLGCSRLIRFPLLIRGILTSLGRRRRARRPAACTDGPGLEPTLPLRGASHRD